MSILLIGIKVAAQHRPVPPYRIGIATLSHAVLNSAGRSDKEAAESARTDFVRSQPDGQPHTRFTLRNRPH